VIGIRWVPTAIEKRRSSDDAIVARYRFYNYQTISGSGGTMIVPSFITIEGQQEDQDSLVDIGWLSLTSYDMSPLATEAFVLNLEGALCWSNDNNQFVQ
jgi:hypothetical protein